MYVHVHVHAYTCMFIATLYMYMYVYMYVHVHLHAYKCTSIAHTLCKHVHAYIIYMWRFSVAKSCIPPLTKFYSLHNVFSDIGTGLKKFLVCQKEDTCSVLLSINFDLSEIYIERRNS